MFRKINTIVKISAVFGIVLAVSGCGKNAQPATARAEETSITAEARENGINLTLFNIPPETTRMFVSFSDMGETEETATPENIVSSFTDIRDAALEEIKKTGRIVFPFVQSGHKYEACVLFEKAGEDEPENWVFANCVAEAGVYFDSGIKLTLNEKHTAVTLSSEPVFSGSARYAPNKYRYGVTIQKEGNWSIGIGDDKSGDSLNWEFQPLVADELKASGYLESGTYPAYATAYCNTVHDNLTWALEIAKSEEFTVSF